MNIGRNDNSVSHSIVVSAPIEKAFSMSTEQFGSFKPAERGEAANKGVESST